MKFTKDVSIVVLMFFTLFPVNFIFLPSMVSSRLLVAIIGLFVLFFKVLKTRKVKIAKNIKTIIYFSLLIAVWSLLCTFIFSSGRDLTYVKLPYTIIVMLLAAYASVKFIVITYKQVTYELVTKFFLLVIIVQSIITISQFVNINVANLFIGIQRLSERQINITNAHFLEESRFIGFGLLFYTASFFYGTALVLIAYRLRYQKMNGYSMMLNMILYLFVFFIGMGMSRSTIIGFASSMLIFIYPIRRFKTLFVVSLRVLFYSGLLIVLFLVFLSCFPDIKDSFDALIENAFDFILAYLNTGKFESDSASGTFNFFILPENVGTYIFGTGLYETYFSVGDYHYSDIGYLRLLYYFGVPGLIMFILFEVELLKMAFKRDGLKPIYYSMVLILLITNIKGLTTLAVISCFYLLIPNRQMIKIK